MSIEAIVWAFKTPVKPASSKLVLIALADNANHLQEAWPCVAALIEKTSLDRKTIFSALDSLEESGLIADTGKRAGSTRQIKIYQMVGLDDGNIHYTYRIDCQSTGEFYVGVRSCYWPVEDDTSYMGSGKWPLMAIRSGLVLTKSIIGQFETRAEAEVSEMQTIRANSMSPLIRNEKGAKNGTVPKTEQYRFSTVTVPKTGHGIPKEPSINKKESVREQKIGFDEKNLTFVNLTDKQMHAWVTAYPQTNVATEIVRAACWVATNPAKRPRSQYGRFLNGWLGRSGKSDPTGSPSRQTVREQRAAFAEGLMGGSAQPINKGSKNVVDVDAKEIHF